MLFTRWLKGFAGRVLNRRSRVSRRKSLPGRAAAASRSANWLVGAGPAGGVGDVVEHLENRSLLTYFTVGSMVAGNVVTFVGDASGDILTLSNDGAGNLQHNRFAAGDGGYESAIDLDPNVGGVQSRQINAITQLIIQAGDGNDTIQLGALNLMALDNVNGLNIDGGTGAVDAVEIQGAVTIGNAGVGRLTISTTESVTQTAALTVQGTTSITGLTASLNLNQANDFVGAVTINSATDVTINDTNAVNFDAINAANLTLTAGGNITDSGVGTIVATGATSLTAGANNIILDTANNNFGGTVTVVSGAVVTLTDVLGIDFGTSNISGAFTVNLSGGGAVTDSGDLTVGGNTQINAAGLNVTLNSAGNNFAGIGINGHTVAIVDSNGVDLRASVITDTYSVTTTAGNITNSGALVVTNAATFTANGNNANITVNNAGNTFNGAVSFVGPQLGSVNVLDLTALVLPTLNLTGNLTAQAAGITQGANTLTIAQATSLTTTGVTDVTLPNGNDFVGAVTINSSQAATINDINGITFGNVTTATNAGTFTVTANGAITDGGAGVMTIGGTTSLTAGAGNNITLNQAANDFGTAVAFGTVTIVSGNNVTLRDANAIDLGASTISGNLSVTSSGNITDSGALTVTGTTTLAAGAANNITLDAANNFSTVSITSGNNVLLNDTNAIDLGASNVSGTLTITAAGNITDSGAVTVAGTTTLTPGAAFDVTLDSANDFLTVVLVNGTNVTLNDTNAIALETSSTLTGTLTVTAGGTITDSNPISVNGNASFTAVGQNITLNNNNDFNTVSAVGAAIVLTDSDNIDLGTVTASGNLTVNATGAVTDSGIVTVQGTSTLSAGVANDITLDTAGNNFVGAVSVGAGGANDVTLVDQNAIVLGAIATSGGGNLNVTAGAGITQTAGVVTITGTTTLSTGAGSDITLTTATNDFQGTVTVTSARHVQIDDANAITFGAVSTFSSGNFTVDAGGDITFGGLVTVTGNVDIESDANPPGAGNITDNAGAGQLLITGTTVFDAGGNNVSFTNAANNFGGAVSVTDGIAGNDAFNVTLVDANAITLGNIFAGGSLTVTVGAGDITATGILDIDGNTLLNGVAGANIIAGNVANNFTGTVNVTPGVGLNNLTLVDTTALQLQAGLNINGNLVAQGAGLTQAAGGITVGGQSTLTSTGGVAMNLSDPANDFIGSVTVNTSGGAVGASIRDVNSIDFGGAPVNTSNVTGPFTVVAAGAITDSGNMVVTGPASFTAGAANNITLDATTNDFQAGVSIVSGNNVVLFDANSIALGASAITGTLTVTANNGAITDNGVVTVAGAGTTLTANGVGINDITFNDVGTDLGGTVTVVNGRNVVLIDSVGGIDLGAITATGALQVTAALGDITNSGALVVNGNSTFTANTAGANITVNNAGNTFVGSVTFAGVGGLNNVTVSDTTPLDLAGLTINGNLTVTSTAQGVTSITDSGNLTVGGTTTLTADPTSNIVLNNNNQFGGAVSVVSGLNVTLNETSANGIVLGASTVSGTYTVTSVKSITQNGALSVTGLPTFTVTDSPTAAPSSQDILLDTQANNFATTPVFTNNGIIQDLKLRNINGAAAIPAIMSVALNGIRDLSIIFNNTAIVLPALQFTRDLVVTAGGDITQSAALTVPRAATFTVPNVNNITLTNAGNNFSSGVVGGGVSVVSGNNVSLTDANAIDIGNLFPVGNVTINSNGTVDFVGTGASNIGGTLNVNNGAAAAADINQTGAGGGGTLTIVGTTTLAAGNAVGNDINLSGNVLPNNFSTVVITSANNVILDDVNGIDLGTSTVTGTLGVNFAIAGPGSVTQSGALTVTGVATFTSFEGAAVAGTQTSDVLLDTQANNFAATPVFVEGTAANRDLRDVKLRNTNAGALVPDTNGIISAGTLRDVTLIFDNNGIAIPAATAINVLGNLVLTAGGAITDAASGPTTVGGTTTLTTTNVGGSLISLTNAANNFTGAVSATNNGAANSNVLLTDVNAIVLGTINTSGNLTVNAVGITQANATALDGATVGGTSTFNGGAGVITLNDANNDFTGAVSLNNNGANNVVVTDANAIVLGASAVGTGTLTVNAIGITQAAAPNAIVQTAGAGAATFNGGAGVITLDDPNNNFTGAVSATNTGAANNVTLTDVNAIVLGTINTAGNLTVNAVGITQSNATALDGATVGGTSTFNGNAGVITLLDPQNDFTGAVSLNNNGANNITVNDANAIVLGASAFGGTLGITASGSISQVAGVGLVGNGVATFTVNTPLSDILLGTANNNLGALPVFTNNGNIRDLALRNINGAAAVPVIPAGLRDLTLDFPNVAIALPNLVLTRNLSVTAGGLIDDNAAASVLTVPGTTTVNSGAANVSFTNVASNFGTVAATAANNVTLVDTDSIDLGASNIAGVLLVTSGAGGGAGSHITESGILVVGTGGSTFTLGGANSDVLLGGFANNIAYPITIATMGGGSLRNFTLQNVAAGPAVINFPAAANDLTLNIVGAIQLGALNLAGNLNLTGTGDITQTGPWVVAGTSTFSPGAANNVTLNNPGNDFNTVLISDGNAGTTPDANNVSITDTDNINFGTSDIGGTLTVNAGTITDSGVVQVDGLATFAPGAGNSTIMDNAGNDFAQVRVNNGSNATFVDANSIILDNIALTNTLTVNVTGNITQNVGTMVVAPGTTTLSGGAAGNITLGNANNDFGTVSISDGNALTAPDANNVTLVDANALDLGASNIGGTLNVTTSGALTDSGNVVVGGITTITAGAANDVTLDSAGNDFQAAVNVLTADDIVLNDVNGILLNQITPIAPGGSLAITAGGNITDTVGASINVNGNANFNAGANNITLGNDVGVGGDVHNFGSLDATGNVVSISEDSNVDLNQISATTLTLTSETGAIIDINAGAINFVGPNGATVALTAANGIGSGNALEGQIANLGLAFRNTTNNNVQFTNTGAMTVVNLGGLLATSNNLAAGGTVVLTANSPVTFAVNTFSAGDLTATANESVAVNTDNVTVNAGVTVQSGAGDILFQAGDRIITGNGANVLAVAVNGDVTFQSAFNDVDGDGSMTLDGTISAHAAGGVVTLDALNQQGVTQIATGTITGNALRLLSTNESSGTFTLNSATNDVNFIAASTTGAISFVDADDLTVGTVTTVGITTTGDNVSLTSGGALLIDDDVALAAGDLTLNSAGNVTQNAGDTIVAAGLELLGAGVVTLTDPANDITTLAAITGASISLGDADDVAVGTVNATVGVATPGNLVIDAGGNVQLNAAVVVNNLDIEADANNAAGGAISGAAALAIGGTTILETGTPATAANDISLTNVNNVFTGDMTIVSANDATLVTAAALNFNGAAVTANLNVTIAGGNLTDSGVVTVGGTSTFTAGANNVILDIAGNNFTGAVSVVSATNATFTDVNAIDFGNVAITGNFVVNAAGVVTDSGVLTIGGTTAVNNAGNAVTFDSAANNFTGAVSASGTNITLVDVNAIDLGTINATGNLQVTSGGAMTDSGTVTVGGTSLLNSTAAASITLDTVTNDFQGVVTIANSLNASIDDANAIGFGNVTTVGNFTVDAGGNVTLGGNINVGGNLSVDANINLPGVGGSITDNGGVGILTITGTTTLNTGNPANGANDISLANGANNFIGVVTINSANDVTIDDVNAITFGVVTTNATFVVDAGGLVTLGGATNVGTNLDIETDANNAAGGGITATAAVVVAGNALFDAAPNGTATNDVTLNAANDFQGPVTIIANDATVNDINALSLGAQTINETLTVTAGGNVTFNGAANIGQNLSINTTTNNVAGGTITDNANVVVGGTTALTAGAANDITLDANNNFGGSVNVVSGNNVTLNDINAIDFSGAIVNVNLVVTAAGDITDTGNIAVTGNASFLNTAGSILLGDGAVNTNFGSLTLNTPNNATVTEDNATDITGNNVIAGSLSLTSAGAVTDGVGTVVAVGAAATISGTSINLTDNAADNFGVTAAATFTASGGGNITINALGTANFGAVTFNTTGNVTINEDSDTDLFNVSTANTLVVVSTGAITDQLGSSVTATGTASFSGTSITLLDNAGDILNVAGNANFAASGGGDVTVNAAGTGIFGSITFNTTGNVTINEDSPMDIAGVNTAAILTLNSTGAITDQAGVSVTTTGAANITGASITLADNAAPDIWNIAGNANLAATSGGNITFNAAGTVNFGSLTVNTTGNVTINEDSATDFNGNSTAAVLTVNSTGAITDNVGGAASIITTGNANLTGASISLGDIVGDVLTVGGNANLIATLGGAITVAAAGAVNFNTLTFNTTGPVTIFEDSQTDLTGISTAGTLALTSTGAILDAATASTTVTGNASFTGTSITLGDQGGDTLNLGSLTFNSAGAVSISENSLTDLAGASTADSLVLISTGAITNQAAANIGVTNNASFNGTSITLGNQAGDTFNAGSLTLNSAGNVTVLEDNASELAGANTAANFSLTSTGAITDAVGATLTTTGTASFSGTSISLTDNGSDALAIAGAASFTATAGAITIAATGAANFLSVNFNATGAVTINEDSASDIAGANTGDSLVLTSTAAITDQANATIGITNNASFSGTAITIGDQVTDLFNAGTLTFNSAGTVSITEDSAMDLAAVSTATTLNLTSSGALADQAGTNLTVTGATTLAAQSITLGDAGESIALNTLTANSVNGAIAITETNGLTLTNVNSFNGSVTITSGGAINIVTATANGAGNDVTITANSGDITVGTVTAADDVTLLSTLGSIVDDVNDATTDITGDAVTLTAANGIGASATGSIDTNATSLDASVTATGNLVINEANGITLTDVDTQDGSITVTAAGSIIATDVASLTDLEINDITITATAGGTITAGNINAGTIGGDVTVTAAGAVFDDGDPATDITADTLVVTAGGAIGSAVNDLDLAVNTLTTNSTGNPQFLSELDTLAVGAADLNAGASTIRLGGGTFQTTAAGNIITSALTVGDGAGATATLAGDGTVTGTVSVAADGIVSPGFSTAILNTASVSFVAGSIFNVEVDGSMAGTLYDQLNVTGTVSLGGATLMTSGTITSSPGQVIVLINNDGLDAVSGTFAGLAEGSVVNINGVNFFISYAGGVGGNDVTLTEAGGTVTLSDNDGAADTWEVRRVGANIQVLNGATIVDSRPFAAGTAINILGEDGQHDTLLVNFTGGDPVPAGDISFTGGSGGGMDRVRLLGDGSTTANYTPSATVANAGVVEFDSGNVLNFTGLEPLDIHAMAAVSLTGSAGQDALTVNLSTDFTLGGANAALRVSGTVNGGTIIETLAVWNSGSLTINGEAGNDTVTITNGANTHGINTITLNGGDDNDSFQINGVISASGSVNFNGDAGNDTFTFANAGQILAGPIDGGADSDTIVGDNDGNAFTVTALNAGTLTGKTTGFTNIENLTGGTSTDTFTLTVAGLNLDGAINGAGGTDTLNLPNIANVVAITAPTPNSGAANSLGAGFTGIENINGNAAIDTFTLSGGTITGVLNGNGASDILNLDNVNNTVIINTANGGTATGMGGFASIENINGNIQTDTFTLTSGGTLSGNLDGGGAADSDVLTLDNVANIVDINAVDGGTATGIGGTFANIENVTGNNNTDLFTISGGGSLSGIVTGSGNNDTLTLDDVVNTVTITGANSGTATGTGGFATIENIVGGSMDDSFTIVSPGSLSGSVNGVGGNDSLTLSNGTNNATINAANGGTATNLGAGFSNIENLNGGTGIDTFTFTNAGSLAGNVTGGTGASNDTIVGDDDGNVFTVNAINGGLLAEKLPTGTFSDIENLTGGDEGDTFIFTNTGSLVGDVNGGDGSDTLVGDDNGNEFIVTGSDAGTLTGKLDDFTNVENLTGGAGADLFTVNPGASLSEAVSGLAGNDTLNVDGDGIVGSFDGGADTDTIDLADVTTVVVDLENTSSTGISGSFSNVETFIGNDTDATLIGTNAVTTWTINGVNDGSLDVPAGTTFFDFTDLQGGSSADTFNVTGIGDITGSINGGEGADLFNISAAITGSLDGQGDADTLTGTEIDDVTLTGSDGGSGFGFTGLEADIGGGFAGIDSLAGAAVGTLTGENVDSTWTLDGDGLGDRFYDDGNDVLEFSGFSTVQGGSGIDTFDVTDATTLELRGGDGADIFNLGAALTGDIFAEGGLDQINFQGGSVSGDVDGGSSAELNYSAESGPISVVVQGLGLIDGYQGTATSIGGIFTNITTVVASSGDDTLTGGDTNSTWELGSTATYQGYGSNQTLQFSDFETLQGGSFSDVFNIDEDYSANLNGGTGDDTFNLGATLTGIVDGEAGTDTLQGSEVDQVTLTDLGTLDGFQGDEPNLTHFDNIDALFGNGGTLIGLSIPSIWRLDGTPTYEAGGNILEIGGFENLQGGASTDEFLVTADSTFNLFGGSGHDLFDIDATLTGSVAGQNGNDTLEGDQIDDVTLFGSAGDGFSGGELDITGNFSGINTITGNGGRILGANVNSTWLLDGTPTYSDGSQTLNISGFDTLQGNSAVDRFTVTAASPFSLRGGAGNDIFTFANGRLTNGGTADGEAGNDTLNGTAATGGLTLAGGGGNDTITGSSFGDSLSGGDGNDIVRGFNGNDTLSGGSGTNTLDGGAGTDTVTDLTTDNGKLTNNLFVGIGRNTLISIERAEIFGDPSDNMIDASAFTLGGVTLHGGAGNDTLIGTGLNDSLDGGDGLDTVRLKFTKNPANPPFITATNTTLSDNNSTDMLQSIEALDLTGHATRATSINAGAFGGFTTLNGGSGNDTLVSGQRDSLVKGGAGHDNLTGGAGWDLMYGGAGNDTVSGGVGNDILRGEAGNDSLLGGSGDDRLFGDAGRDVIKGGDGQDSIDGGADNDTILGEAGHDTITGGAGNDLISGGAGHDTMFGGAGNDTILGDDGDDSISGDAGADVLLGGAGNDKISGGADKDLVAGQAGDDTLVGAQSNEINEFFIFDFHKLLI